MTPTTNLKATVLSATISTIDHKFIRTLCIMWTFALIKETTGSQSNQNPKDKHLTTFCGTVLVNVLNFI